jgi:hypothetical protein
MIGAKRLVVVDDNPRFVVHVWRQLTAVMEFGFPSLPPSTAGEPERRFECISPDGLLVVQWHNPNKQGLDAFIACFKDGREPWALIDVRGVRTSGGASVEGWRMYYDAFNSLSGASKERVRVVSSYGPRGWGTNPPVHPKTVDSLRALCAAMLPDARHCSSVSDRTHRNVLITGAGFEFRDETQWGESIGYPSTTALLNWMMTTQGASPLPIDGTPNLGKGPGYPVPFDNRELREAAKDERLDDYWNALLSHLYAIKEPTRQAQAKELAWREAFRRAFIAYDIGHQIQSLLAAKLNWDFWLTTNYTRFADRAIDLINDRDDPPWRSITTSIEEGATAAQAHWHGSTAEQERVLVKLHGDIGHVWTMAIAGHDKQPHSQLFVRPELYRMYALAESMLLRSMWQPQLETCTWHIVGHGLRDVALLRLIATVILRSSRVTHSILLVSPETHAKDKPTIWLQQLKAKFRDAGESLFAERLALPGENVESAVSCYSVAARARDYMTGLARLGLEAARRDPQSLTPARL